MFTNNKNSEASPSKWLHPNEVLKLQRLKFKKKQLNARINKSNITSLSTFPDDICEQDLLTNKRKNFSITNSNNKRVKCDDTILNNSSDQTLFQILNLNQSVNDNTKEIEKSASFSQSLKNFGTDSPQYIEVEKPWIPIDWSLKSRVRLLSEKPFPWNQKLKINEEASGLTAFVRCLNSNSETKIDTSPNTKFHQCCLYWQQPSLPWINLFPRSPRRSSIETSVVTNSNIRESLQRTWADSLRSLFQLVRTRHCPFFYICLNTYTILFRAAGINGYSEMNALITPTTRGFRQLLQQEDIEFIMPLKTKQIPDLDCVLNKEEEKNEVTDEKWLKSIGVNAEDIKQINYTQTRLNYKSDSEIDNSEQSLVLIEGVEVHALYNFLINCKNNISLTGPLAGIPPTLLAPVAFHGATLCSLNVRETKVSIDKINYFSVEINGPILPNFIHNLCEVYPLNQQFTAVFTNFIPTLPFSKVKRSQSEKENKNLCGFSVFEQENLSDCGLTSKILKHFCSTSLEYIVNVESIKYNPETKTYTWL